MSRAAFIWIGGRALAMTIFDGPSWYVCRYSSGGISIPSIIVYCMAWLLQLGKFRSLTPSKMINFTRVEVNLIGFRMLYLTVVN